MKESISESKTGKEIYTAPEIEAINLVAESAFLQDSWTSGGGRPGDIEDGGGD